MNVDIEQLNRIASRLLIFKIAAHYGDEGVQAYRELSAAVFEIFRSIPYEIISQPLVVLRPLAYASPLALDGERVVLDRPDDLRRYLDRRVVLEISSDSLIAWVGAPEEVSALAPSSLVYEFRERDVFSIGGEIHQLDNPTSAPTLFGAPTYFSLEEALEHYERARARYSTCDWLRRMWCDPRRYLLKNQPEGTMRTSLLNHLRSALRNAEVRPEQNVDESHPVDIRVTWTVPYRIALIEIKWLGASGDKDCSRITTAYAAGRAQEGADQLARYLEDNRQQAPEFVTLGYLVVFDARRGGLKIDPGGVSCTNPAAFRDAGFVLDPRYEEVRDDFRVPRRLYLAPEGVV
jgi:hypothetical protein